MLKKTSKKYYYCLLLSFFVLLGTSKNSFLYAFNDWVDANAFFTVGKSIMNGVVPYRDLFEQKGIILYFIYGFGYLLYHKGFYGVFILELFSFSIFLYYLHKIFNMYLDSNYSLVLLPIIAFLTTTSFSFVHGGSCEEFALPYLMISFYYYFKHFKVKKLDNKEYLINGILCGIVFMMKYTMIGFWVGFGFLILFDYLRNKDYKGALRLCLYFFIGVFIPISICLIYLGFNVAIKKFIDYYFIINMTSYNSNESLGILGFFNRSFSKFFYTLIYNWYILLFLLLFVPLYALVIRNERNHNYFIFGLIVLYVMTIIFIFCGYQSMKYYLLPVFIFLVIPFLSLGILFDKYILPRLKNIKFKKYSYVLFVIVFVICVYLSFLNANYSYARFFKKKDYFQFKYADYINSFSNPTLINMGFLDGGLYTTTGIVPNVEYFEVQNIDYSIFPDNIDGQRKAVQNKEVKFILYYTEDSYDVVKKNNEYIWDNYELVYDDTYYFEDRLYNAFLFKLKGLKK